MVIVGSSPERHAGLVSQLPGEVAVHSVTREPTVAAVQVALTQARAHRPKVIVGLGGGSVIDTAKAVGALLEQTDPPEAFLEVIGAGRPVALPGIPVVAVPTCAGAGTEVTRNAVLSVPEHAVKVSLRGPGVLAEAALVDPLLTLDCPPAVTASSGMDALTQCLEPLVSAAANPFSDPFARDGLRRAARNVRRAYASSEDVDARTEMSLASIMGGMALTHAKLGAVHGLAGVLGGLLGAPHGAICARLLPPVITTTIQALEQRGPDSAAALDRYNEAAAICLGGQASRHELAPWLNQLVDEMQIPRLTTMGWDPGLSRRVVQAAIASSSMRGHPLTLTDEELGKILASAA